MKYQRLVKTLMLGTVGGDQPRGKPARRWSHNIKDWCHCTLPDAVFLANDTLMQDIDWP